MYIKLIGNIKITLKAFKLLMQRYLTRKVLCWVAMVLLLVGCGPLVSKTPTLLDGDYLTISINYRMEDRFGRDDNQNGLMDLPNTCEYVHNLSPGGCAGGIPAEEPKFAVTLEGGAKMLSYAVGQPQKRYEFIADNYLWEITGPGITGSLEHVEAGPQWSVYLQEGEYLVTLTVEGHYGESQRAMQSFTTKINVNDILIVSIGDSYASGEGNPELKYLYPGGDFFSVVWADDGVSAGLPIYYPSIDSAVAKDHIRSHRSTLAGPAQAALAIERAQPHTSVTFVSTAASGATISEGLLGEYDGAEDPFNLPNMKSQIDQVKELVGKRKIDYLFVSVGGNDIGFSNILKALLLRGSTPNSFGPKEDCSGDIPYCLIERAIHSGNWNLVENYYAADLVLNLKNTSGLDKLRDQLYGQLNSSINTLDVGTVRIVNYPDPFYFTGTDGKIYWCPEIMGYIVSDLKVGPNELKWAREHAYLPLNQAVRDAAEAHDWWLADVQSQFYGHGYCADKPYEPENYPGNPFPNIVQPWPTSSMVRWFRRAGESEIIQGGDRKSTTGTMHPNEFGHQAIAEELSNSIIILLNGYFSPPNPSDPIPITPLPSINTNYTPTHPQEPTAMPSDIIPSITIEIPQLPSTPTPFPTSLPP